MGFVDLREFRGSVHFAGFWGPWMFGVFLGSVDLIFACCEY